jgi:hypothetical protein
MKNLTKCGYVYMTQITDVFYMMVAQEDVILCSRSGLFSPYWMEEKLF